MKNCVLLLQWSLVTLQVYLTEFLLGIFPKQNTAYGEGGEVVTTTLRSPLDPRSVRGLFRRFD